MSVASAAVGGACDLAWRAICLRSAKRRYMHENIHRSVHIEEVKAEMDQIAKLWYFEPSERIQRFRRANHLCTSQKEMQISLFQSKPVAQPRMPLAQVVH